MKITKKKFGFFILFLQLEPQMQEVWCENALFIPEKHSHTDMHGFATPTLRSTRFFAKQSKKSLILGDFLVKNGVSRSHRGTKRAILVRKCFVQGLRSNSATKSCLFSP